MRGLWAVLVVVWAAAVVVWAAAVVVWAASSCNTHKTCSDCIISPSCIWCGKENFTELPRCGSNSLVDRYYGSCEGFMTDPQSSLVSVEDQELSGDDASAHQDTIIQIRPQKVEMYSRVGEENQILFTYKHLRNYPVDLYYLMDGSKSMSDDKAMLTQLGKVLVESIKEITSNFKVGFGIFVDKTILPFISTVPFKPSASCGECEAPYSYKNILKLTDDSTTFVDAVNKSKSATNLDYPEGSLDALMQAIVCEEQVDWRLQSIRLILVSTDAGFHIAGDGKLGGITRPNDRSCHLDRHGVYTHDAIMDYPSVGEIREMVEEKEVHLIFAITRDQEPLYDHLKDLIPRTSYNILAQDSSNIIDILTNKVKDVISRVSLRVKESFEDISVKLYSNCSDGSWKEHSACTNLDAGDELTFRADVVVKKCPEDQEKWNRRVIISPGSYTNINLTLDLTMICECRCEKPGDQGFVPSADQCNKHGDYKCGVCSCHAGYRGHKCECDVNAGDGTISDASCKHTNSSLICSGQGECKCGECECNERTQPERIWGEFCECTNYKECTSPNGGELCSSHGDCECNACVCVDGWVGQFCECDNSTQLSCSNPQTGEICSGQGDCECNHCKCEAPYYGKFCEDCPECSGKCEVYKPCVECQVFSRGELHTADLCSATCTLFNSTILESIGEMNGQTCTYFDDEKCRVYFLYETNADGALRVWVQEKVDCPTYHNIYYTMLGMLLAVVVIGVCVLIAWRIIVSLHDKREFEKFILDKQNAKWSEEVNPLYKPAITHVNNPMFATKMD